MKIIFATANKGKLREAEEILGDGFELVSPASLGITEDIAETGDTLKENSMIKARYIFEKTGMNCFADDTGLEVDALGGAPGVHTARYGVETAVRDGLPVPPDHDFEANMDALLRELEKHPGEPRTARFHSVVTLILDGEEHFFDGILEGRIAMRKSGHEGFGYDPVFLPDDYPGKTMAEMSLEAKNAVSHRGKALRAMAAWLKEREV